MVEMFYFLLFYNALDLNNLKILCLPSILLFERTVHKMNHPTIHGSRKCIRLNGPISFMDFFWQNGLGEDINFARLQILAK